MYWITGLRIKMKFLKDTAKFRELINQLLYTLCTIFKKLFILNNYRLIGSYKNSTERSCCIALTQLPLVIAF